MHRPRLIPCLLLAGSRLVKTTSANQGACHETPAEADREKKA